MHPIGFTASHAPMYITNGAVYHAMNHIGFMISPEFHVVQDKVHGSPKPNMV